jgi:competence protein ComGC
MRARAACGRAWVGTPRGSTHITGCKPSRRAARAFTIIDVLVSVAVIALLLSLMMPGLSLVRETARRVVCASNVRQVGLGLAMFADDNKDTLPSVLLDSLLEHDQYQLSMRIRIAPNRWDGLGLLWSREYLSSGQAFYCPSHTGEHPYSAYASQWNGGDGEVYGNLQYRYLRPTPQRGTLITLYSSPGMALLSDGLRTRGDFNHRVGSNVMRTDLAVLWFADPTGQVLATLPASEDDPTAAARVQEAWDQLDAVNGERR